MSDANPFEKPVEASTNQAYQTPEAAPSGPPAIPTPLMVIGIIGLLLGLQGLFFVCMGGVGLAMSEAALGFMPDEETRVAMRELMDLQFIPSLIQIALSLIISPLLIAASIGCLTRKPWSQGLMKFAIVGSILSVVIGLGINAWMLLFHWDIVNAPNAAQPGGEAMGIFGQAIAIGFSLVTLGFFVWAFIAMGGQNIKSFYDQISSSRR